MGPPLQLRRKRVRSVRTDALSAPSLKQSHSTKRTETVSEYQPRYSAAHNANLRSQPRRNRPEITAALCEIDLHTRRDRQLYRSQRTISGRFGFLPYIRIPTR